MSEFLTSSPLPKICVPLTGENPNKVIEQLNIAVDANPDILELRGDYASISDVESIIKMPSLKNLDIPLIFTWRTENEGGHYIAQQNYLDLAHKVIDSGIASYIDVENSQSSPNKEAIITYAQKNNVGVILSYHNFSDTPDRNQLLGILKDMRSFSPTAVKIATTANSPRDTLCIFDVTLAHNTAYPEIPIISMAMGEYGTISRVGGHIFGSCLTFATVGQSSAPGQLPIDKVREVLKTVGYC